MLILEYRTAPVGTPQVTGCAITIGRATGVASPTRLVMPAPDAAPTLTVGAATGAGSGAAAAAN